ncbi:MAG: HAD hydrolase-like protein [Oscillospiraceae bacterium]|jgi:phosphoglycolate phosphatase|nr:HAD hydrolase-like protein [Oscillospiraceae bacterium]
MLRFDAVLFDFDGTFADTAEGIVASANYALRTLGYPEHTTESWRPCLGPSLEFAFHTFVGMPLEQAHEAIRLYRSVYGAGNHLLLSVFPGMDTLLLRMNECGIKAGIATTKPTKYAAEILEKLGYLKYFTAVCGTELNRHNSDKSDLVRAALAVCGTAPNRTLMVGDRKYDILGAKMNECRSCGVLYGFGSEAELREAGADCIVSDVAELMELILGANR